jgi:hypothetical protein
MAVTLSALRADLGVTDKSKLNEYAVSRNRQMIGYN